MSSPAIPSALQPFDQMEFAGRWRHLFAGTMNITLGWPVVGILRNRAYIHFMVEAPDGRLWDAVGGWEPEDALARYHGDTIVPVGREADIRNLALGRDYPRYNDLYFQDVRTLIRDGIIPSLPKMQARAA